MSDYLSTLTKEDKIAAELLAARFEKRSRNAPMNTLIALALSLLVFGQGLYWMVTTKAAMEPGSTILEKLDAVPSDPSVPAILRVSGQSRKGLLLIEAESQVRSFDAVLAATGFTLFAIGGTGLVIVYSRRRDGQRDLLIAKLIRSHLRQTTDEKTPTPP